MQENSARQRVADRMRSALNVSPGEVLGSFAIGAGVVGTSHATPEIIEWLDESAVNRGAFFVGLPTVVTGLYLNVRQKLNRQ